MSFLTTVKHIFCKKRSSEKSKKTASSLISCSTNIKTKAPSTATSTNSRQGNKFKYEDGRRFHADQDVSYILPNDDDGMQIKAKRQQIHKEEHLSDIN